MLKFDKEKMLIIVEPGGTITAQELVDSILAEEEEVGMANPEWDNYRTKTGIDLIADELGKLDRQHRGDLSARVGSALGVVDICWGLLAEDEISPENRRLLIRNLAKAGALIASEIDQLLGET